MNQTDIALDDLPDGRVEEAAMLLRYMHAIQPVMWFVPDTYTADVLTDLARCGLVQITDGDDIAMQATVVTSIEGGIHGQS